MPIYEYTCSSCDKTFDYLARTLADKPAACPSCGAKKLRKQLTSFAKPAAVTKGCGSCASESACPAAAGASGCGCAGACGHH